MSELSDAKGRLIVISGPSGVGKTTVCAELMKRFALIRAVTATTRSPREGEKNGVDYRFLSEEEFEKGIEAGRFLEHAQVFGRYYGTPRETVEQLISGGRDVLLAIDVQGAQQIREKMPGAVTIFLSPPDWEALERRLSKRGTESKQDRRKRLERARAEMECRDRYDHVVVNDELERAVTEIQGILGF